jgi:hypothetical protein
MFDHRTAKALQEHRFNPVTRQAEPRTGATPVGEPGSGPRGGSRLENLEAGVISGVRFGVGIRGRLRRAASKGTL